MAKVIFLHLSVILFTGEVSASVHAGIPPLPRSRHTPPLAAGTPGSRPPQEQTPQARHPPEQTHTPLGVGTPLGVPPEPPGADTPRHQTSPQEQTPPGSRHPPDQTPPGADTPPGTRHPPEQTPPGTRHPYPPGPDTP